MKKNLLIIFSLIFIFEFSFSFYYACSEYKKNGQGNINPFYTGYEYIFPPGYEKSFNDWAAYNKLAYSIIEKGSYEDPFGKPTAMIVPGYPIFLSLIYFIFGYSLIPVLIINSILITLSFYILFKIALIFYNKRIAYILLFLLTINIRISHILSMPMTESLFVPIIAICLYMTLNIVDMNKKGMKNFILLGLLGGYGILVRPVIIPFLFIIILYLIMKKIKLSNFLVLIICISLAPSIWIIRNYNVFGRFTFINDNYSKLYVYNYDAYKDIGILDPYFLKFYLSEKDSIFLENLKLECKAKNEDTIYLESKSTEISKRYNENLRSHIPFYIKMCVWGFKALLFPYTSDMSNRNKLISTIIWSLSFLPSLFTVIFFRKKYVLIMFILALSLLIAPALVAVDKYLRYQIPAEIILSVLSSITIFYFINKLKKSFLCYKNINNHFRI
jgi:4-amino-4-deoxy-L-arabinose transferase-like glycosyltransferase